MIINLRLNRKHELSGVVGGRSPPARPPDGPGLNRVRALSEHAASMLMFECVCVSERQCHLPGVQQEFSRSSANTRGAVEHSGALNGPPPSWPWGWFSLTSAAEGFECLISKKTSLKRLVCSKI